MNATEIVLYTTPDGTIKIDTIFQDETIWLTQAKMAELFDIKRSAITKHLKNIFESGELDKKVVGSILEHTTPNSLTRTHCLQLKMEKELGRSVIFKQAFLDNNDKMKLE
ncbi:Putative DNA-binding protein in cluster with Type I restriction-modification system [uncultured Gammaproteobacteria bacterium]|jgi:hypothetical protein|nr:Putative DNA-binding protein in cluster with Type I restriction-modification system [uncultured Gammaproteobacteria bacterium]